MIEADEITLAFGSKVLFENVKARFTEGNCYGLIGANGAGKSSFLKILAGDMEPNSGRVITGSGQRISMLRQDHFAFDNERVLDTVIMGNKDLYAIIKEKEAIYSKADFSAEDGERAAELEDRFAELDGWNAEAEAAEMLSGLDIPEAKHHSIMGGLTDQDKVRVLLAQALFGNPHILLLDEPTNHLDLRSILWLEEFLADFKNTVIVVSHDRHFLNNVCTHTADIDYKALRIYAGNYDFWYQSSQLALKQRQDLNRKSEEKAKELKSFIERFSANAAKSKQATARKRMLERLDFKEIPPSTRRYPHIVFNCGKTGNDVVTVKGATIGPAAQPLISNLSFTVAPRERIAILSANTELPTALLQRLSLEAESPDTTKTPSEEVVWGASINRGVFPKDQNHFFEKDLNLIEWLSQFSDNHEDNFVRSFLGKMLFSRDDTLKKATVLSGGERVRCMLAKLMLKEPNALLLDGPTDHLDLESITALNNGLLKYQGTLLFTSHDTEFIKSLATRILVLNKDGIEVDLSSFDEYVAYCRREEAGH